MQCWNLAGRGGGGPRGSLRIRPGPHHRPGSGHDGSRARTRHRGRAGDDRRPRPGHDRGRCSGNGDGSRPRARRSPGPVPGSPCRHLPDDDHRHRPDRPPPPDRPRHPGDQEAGIGTTLPGYGPAPEHRGTGEGSLTPGVGPARLGLRAADPQVVRRSALGSLANSLACGSLEQRSHSPERFAARASGSPAVLESARRTHPRGSAARSEHPKGSGLPSTLYESLPRKRSADR